MQRAAFAGSLSAVRGLAPLLTLALWRSTSGLKMLVLLGAGVFVAATLLAAAPIYARAMADLGLTFAIRDELAGRERTRVEFRQVPLQTAEGETLRAAVEQRIDERLGWFRADQSRSIRLGLFSAYHEGEADRRGAPLGMPQSFAGYESHVQLTEGRLPETTAPGEPIEVAMSQRAARDGRFRLGETFELREAFDNCVRSIQVEPFPPPPPPCDNSIAFTYAQRVTLVGIIEPLDEADPFWTAPLAQVFPSFILQIDGAGPVLPMFTTEATLLDNFGATHPGYLVDVAWSVYANTEALNRANVDRAAADLRGLYTELEPYGAYAFSPLRDTLESFGDTADYQQTPLTILLLQITGIALFYVGLIAAIVVERQSQEIALLRSRGATLPQIALLYALQGLVIGVPAVILAPWLAAAATALLGLTPTFHDVSNGDLLPVTMVPLAYPLAILGVVLSLVALLVPVMAVAARGSLAVRRAESRPGRSVIQRYYLDLVLAGGAILLLVELRQRDSVFTPSSTGGVSSDPLLLASPALAIAAAAALILRFNPLLLRLLSWFARSVPAPALSLGLWQLVRNSGQYTRLALLLMMAVAVGTFAASYTTTAEASYRDRANHLAGADLRAGSSSAATRTFDPAVVEPAALALPGVERATAVIRTTAGVATAGSSASNFQLLGIDPATAPDLLWSRDDYADAPLARVLRRVAPGAGGVGLAIPVGSTELSVRVRPNEDMEGVIVRAGIRGAGGAYRTIDLGELVPGTDWQELRGPLVPSFGKIVEPPFELLALTFSNPTSRSAERYISFDDITAIGPGGPVLIEGFEAGGAWTTFPDRTPTVDRFEILPDAAATGAAGGRYAFRPGPSNELRGIYLNNFLTPLPIVVSDSFLARTGATVGSAAMLVVNLDTLVPVVIVDHFALLPTTTTAAGPVIVIDRDALTRWSELSDHLGTPRVGPAEIWFDLAEGADEAALTAALIEPPFRLDRAVSRSAELERANRNPLIAAGGSGILALAFVAVLGLVGAALITQLLASVARRRVELAVTRALGLSRGQVVRMLALEYGVVVVTGVIAGVVLGLFVSGQMLSFLEVTQSGARVEPPFELKTEWLVVAGAAVLVAASCVAALVVVARDLSRPNEAAALRAE